MEIEKILDIVKKTGREVIFSKDNGDAYVISKLEDYYKKLEKNDSNNGLKIDDDYAISVKKLIMP
ncbi:MAG: hypothetical protein PHH83_00620 [Patescibacteria group bacterium]|nr:hypothetical protein [Patescibacteria group bacterium]